MLHKYVFFFLKKFFFYKPAKKINNCASELESTDSIQNNVVLYTILVAAIHVTSFSLQDGKVGIESRRQYPTAVVKR